MTCLRQIHRDVRLHVFTIILDFFWFYFFAVGADLCVCPAKSDISVLERSIRKEIQVEALKPRIESFLIYAKVVS